MRDPERITAVLNELHKVWEKNPDLRLGQIIVNMVQAENASPEIFYFEDDVLLLRLKGFLETQAP